MGMGEPLYNFDNVKTAMEIASDGEGLSVSKRRITLSTSGVVPMIARAGARRLGVMLAISLHAVRDELRDVLVPINRKYPIAELLEACRTYPGLSNARRITFEYVMLKGVNDSLAEARGAGAAARRHSGEDQPHSVQPLAGRALRVLRLGADRALRRSGEPRRLCQPDPHAARPRHHAACGQLKSASVKQRASERPWRSMRRRAAAGSDAPCSGRPPAAS